MKDAHKKAQLILKVGVAFAFVYAAVAGMIAPDNWIGYFPPFLQDLMPAGTLLSIWGVSEIILAIWILSGWKLYISGILAAVAMLGLIIFNFGAMDILFRDVTIALAAIALAVDSYPEKTAQPS